MSTVSFSGCQFLLPFSSTDCRLIQGRGFQFGFVKRCLFPGDALGGPPELQCLSDRVLQREK